MLKLKKEELKNIEFQMFNKARDIDVAIYNVLFNSDMPKMYVSMALSGYQNKDGGFGHALEIDNYNKDSSVYETYEALRIVYECGFESISEDETLEYMMKKAFNYLYNKCQNWCPLVETNNNAICASWFKYTDDNIKRFGDAPTPAIIAYTLYLLDAKSPYYKMAYKKCEGVIKNFLLKSDFNLDEYISYKELYNVLVKRGLYKEYLEEYKKVLFEVGSRLVIKDESKFNTNGAIPLVIFDDYTNDAAIDELIDKNLDYIISNRPSHGLWEGGCDWMNEYPEAATAQIKWMGVITIRNLIYLKKFNRIED